MDLVLGMGEEPLALGRADSALVYAARAEHDFAAWAGGAPSLRPVRVLAALQPYDLALAGQVRVVRYHVDREEEDLAQIEGGYALETVDFWADAQRDPGARFLALRARAELLLVLGDAREAAAELADLWRSDPGSPAAEWADLRAAELAESSLYDPGLARDLYRELRERSSSIATRRRAEVALGRLQRP